MKTHEHSEKAMQTDAQLAVAVEELEVLYDGNASPAISGVSLRASLGEMVLFVGPNGGGKTTLLRAIAGLVRPSRGRVAILGRDPYRDLAVRRLIAYVPQIKELNIHAPLTVWDLVAFGRYPRAGLLRRLSERDREIIERAISSVGLHDKADKRLSELSGGQLNRAIIARALAQEPLIYLLDEPFESIDNPSESMIMSILKKEKESGKLVIVTEHHIAEPEEFSKVVLINRRIISAGRPSEVLTAENLRSVYSTAVIDT